MEHRVFSSYYQLALKGHVEPWPCIDKTHSFCLFPEYNFETEETTLKCIYPDCKYSLHSGKSKINYEYN